MMESQTTLMSLLTPEYFPWNKHGHLPAICSILLTQLFHQPSFLQYSAKDNINCKNSSGKQINISAGTNPPQQSNTPTIPRVPDIAKNPVTMKGQATALSLFLEVAPLIQAKEIAHIIHSGACIEHKTGIDEQ